jgi:hypothetical protein
MEPALNLEVAPVWDEVERVREATFNFLRSHDLHQDTVDALTMVACELTENAIKYGEFKGGEQVSVQVLHKPRSILVEVKNPLGDGAVKHLGTMDRMIQWIRGRQDPFEAYLARLQEISTQDLYEKESRLGLVRIAYEGQSILDFYVDDTNTLAVSAVCQL